MKQLTAWNDFKWMFLVTKKTFLIKASFLYIEIFVSKLLWDSCEMHVELTEVWSLLFWQLYSSVRLINRASFIYCHCILFNWAMWVMCVCMRNVYVLRYHQVENILKPLTKFSWCTWDFANDWFCWKRAYVVAEPHLLFHKSFHSEFYQMLSTQDRVVMLVKLNKNRIANEVMLSHFVYFAISRRCKVVQLPVSEVTVSIKSLAKQERNNWDIVKKQDNNTFNNFFYRFLNLLNWNRLFFKNAFAKCQEIAAKCQEITCEWILCKA